MDMKTIIADWKKNAKRHDERSFEFLHGLKMEDDEDAVDAFAKKLHEEAFSIIGGDGFMRKMCGKSPV